MKNSWYSGAWSSVIKTYFPVIFRRVVTSVGVLVILCHLLYLLFSLVTWGKGEIWPSSSLQTATDGCSWWFQGQSCCPEGPRTSERKEPCRDFVQFRLVLGRQRPDSDTIRTRARSLQALMAMNWVGPERLEVRESFSPTRTSGPRAHGVAAVLGELLAHTG